MIKIIAMTNKDELVKYAEFKDMPKEVKWCWIDFDQPTEKEAALLEDKFQFHPIAIADCFNHAPRPKIEFFGAYNYLVIHSLDGADLIKEEVDIFISEKYIITFHTEPNENIEKVVDKLCDKKHVHKTPLHVLYLLTDELVDDLFPAVESIEERLFVLENIAASNASSQVIDEVFAIKSDLLKIQHAVSPMKDLLYRLTNSERMSLDEEDKIHFMSIFEHLVKIHEKVTHMQTATSDMRDNINSVLSYKANESSEKMNRIMMNFTALSAIFMPLTFLVGVYGMNFDIMPELRWKYGYLTVVGAMFLLSVVLVVFFRKKKWLGSTNN